MTNLQIRVQAHRLIFLPLFSFSYFFDIKPIFFFYRVDLSHAPTPSRNTSQYTYAVCTQSRVDCESETAIFFFFFVADAGFSMARLAFEGSVDTERLLPQAPADLQRRRQQPIPQRVTTVTCLVLFLNLQTLGKRNREREKQQRGK